MTPRAVLIALLILFAPVWGAVLQYGCAPVLAASPKKASKKYRKPIIHENGSRPPIVLRKVTPTPAPAPTPKSVTVTYFDTATWCGPCKLLKRFISDKGGIVLPSIPGPMHPAPKYYPAVHYSDGKVDKGERVFSGEAKLSKHVYAVEWE